jgi:ribosomal protein L13
MKRKAIMRQSMPVMDSLDRHRKLPRMILKATIKQMIPETALSCMDIAVCRHYF